MGETIGDMNIKPEHEDNKKSILENKIGIADDNVGEEGNKLDLNKISNKKECDEILYRKNRTLNNHKYIEN